MSIENTEENFAIGERIKEERDRLGLTQEEFGTRVGTTGRTIIKYELNETSPKSGNLILMHRLGIDIWYVLTGERMALGVTQTRKPYTAAERTAVEVQKLVLTEEDSQLLLAFARRLSGNGKKCQ